MDQGFVRSGEFRVGVVIAVLILASGAFVVAEARDWGLDGCEAHVPGGDKVAASGTDSATTDRVWTRETRWAVEGNLTVYACTEVGTVAVTPSDDAETHVAIIVRTQWGIDSLVAAPVAILRMTEDGEGHALAVWFEAGADLAVPWWFGGPGIEVDVEIRLPPDGVHDLHLFTTVGAVELRDLRIDGLEARVDVGDVEATGVEAQGEVRVKVDVGDIDLRLRPTGDADVDMETDVGAIDLELPRENETGYSVSASVDVGDIAVSLGPWEVHDRDMEGPGGSVTSRTEGFDAVAVKWRIQAHADVGDVTIDKR